MKKLCSLTALTLLALTVSLPTAQGQNPYFQMRLGLTPGLGTGFGYNPYAALYSNAYANAAIANNYYGNLAAASAYGGYGGYGYGGYGGYGNAYYYDPYGGYLRGAADVISSQGQLMVNQQQAFQMREQYRQMKIDTRRKAFDEYRYEMQNTPTPEEERQRRMLESLNRSRNNPPVTEVYSGKALNDLLADLRKQQGNSQTAVLRTFPIPLDAQELKHINVTQTPGVGNIGAIKNGRLEWPLALSGEEFKTERDRVNAILNEALKQAESTGKVDSGALKQLGDDVERLRQQLRRNGADLPFAQYTDAKSFLNNLEDAMKVLRQPDAGNYFNGKYALQAKSVGELVKFMSQQGLWFAPATPGDEAAYTALHQALAGYDVALASSPK